MQFINVSTNTITNDNSINNDYESAKSFGKVQVGNLGIYYKEGFKTRYIPYIDSSQAFIRVQEVNGRMCCATAKFAYFKLIFIVNSREIMAEMTENEKEIFACLDEIKIHAPKNLEIGYKKQ